MQIPVGLLLDRFDARKLIIVAIWFVLRQHCG